eukprot:TRINITY_DN6620_c0_g1_i2.p2 TRINITY_DN6620_c0_g1~~TRINITY_DN6620_c0_g1_i2.p2  ORF type:complete len:110 (+),score=22.13 TRINITY_DN6620_c0_g1_i2:1216-1545(+)
MVCIPHSNSVAEIRKSNPPPAQGDGKKYSNIPALSSENSQDSSKHTGQNITSHANKTMSSTLDNQKANVGGASTADPQLPGAPSNEFNSTGDEQKPGRPIISKSIAISH